ncbi:MAG: CDP-diacylglycerol---glycerol-3-phosphate 3-phosphatidyltransferase [Pseudonocardiales bacterium]|jgi:CDP-diacylglycerol--glycerol-3-phosphate 3-phosphatidyltransferase|uniref:CDP-diacylglycerol--glycerol-3-phosphate 3-phosphatidyltransferase n=1 Tax=Pseudonocardia sp. TaxID=60912 RepID=UPI0026022E35|nr:CDP-diacylglycerol--glycerol-3-phosphate 3-phosphatidyltransferase [Pseudonocardia sp.]MCW2717828.1 CDP-diacylglycerol/glycerol-3-phosphate 3-phosphatidyltransferase [Pseudonocardia sp.]MDT7616051.1 CDP-diacylglycerol---glycerol-3-phosphate 3-phosphatidyltransferase [Pseudonocardiales bacterium]MDT7705558.1 CDP-diacylglycerol---glycerol-3-phosphate 3-phosphatidyltransferase [Pseudonocardiales bacterium]
MTTVPSGPPPLLNIANVLTGVRLVLVPVFLAALFTDGGTNTGWRLVASGVFALAAITDRFDGELARSRGLVTSFGTIADPIADKALMGSALIGLSMLGQVWWWVTIVIMVREVGITVLRFSVLRHGIIPASRGGKAKTLVQTVAIGLYVLPLVELTGHGGAVDGARGAVMAVAVVLTVVTGIDYVLRAARLRSASASA